MHYSAAVLDSLDEIYSYNFPGVTFVSGNHAKVSVNAGSIREKRETRIAKN